MRQGDDVERAFLFGGGHEIVHGAEDFSSTLTALPLVSEELLLLEPQAAMENASTAAIEPAANLRREIMSFLVVFLRTDNKELNDDD